MNKSETKLFETTLFQILIIIFKIIGINFFYFIHILNGNVEIIINVLYSLFRHLLNNFINLRCL